MPYTAEDPYLYAQAGQVTAAQVQVQAQAQAQAQAHAQVQQAPPAMTGHNPLSTFAAQATSMQQPPNDIMWRQGTPGAGSTWQEWTAAVVDNQDRYSANALMALGASARPSSVNDGPPQPPEMGMGGLDGANVPPAGNSQWPLLLFHDGTGMGGT